jgi:hypothetical protein
MHGAVAAIAGGDFPLYLSMQIGMKRNGVGVWAQDLKMTAIFAFTLLALHYLRHLL